jgi:hypothetical protein
VNTSQKRILKEAPYSFKPVMMVCTVLHPRGIVRILGGPQDVGLIIIIIFITKTLFNFNIIIIINIIIKLYYN